MKCFLTFLMVVLQAVPLCIAAGKYDALLNKYRTDDAQDSSITDISNRVVAVEAQTNLIQSALQKSGGTMTGDIDMGGYDIYNILRAWSPGGSPSRAPYLFIGTNYMNTFAASTQSIVSVIDAATNRPMLFLCNTAAGGELLHMMNHKTNYVIKTDLDANGHLNMKWYEGDGAMRFQYKAAPHTFDFKNGTLTNVSSLLGGSINLSGSATLGGDITLTSGNLYVNQGAKFVSLADDADIRWGESTDYWAQFNSTSNKFEFWSTDVDGAGTDGLVMYMTNGNTNVYFNGILYGSGAGLTALAAAQVTGQFDTNLVTMPYNVPTNVPPNRQWVTDNANPAAGTVLNAVDGRNVTNACLPRFKMFTNSDQDNLADDSHTLVEYDMVAEDTHGGADTNNHCYVIPFDSSWILHASINAKQIDDADPFHCELKVGRTGVTNFIARGLYVSSIDDGTYSAEACGMTNLLAGDRIHVRLYSTTDDGGVDIDGTDCPDRTFLWGVCVGIP